MDCADPGSPLIKTEDVLTGLDASTIRLQDSEAARRDATRIIDDIAHFLDILSSDSDAKRNLLQDAERLRFKGYPAETIIAFCGETGAGKSSLINALLGESVVRTSGMAACTSVITEIRHNDKDTIEADIQYLTTAEWKDELQHLVKDLQDTPNGRVRRRSDMTDEAAVAWDKIHAVYPDVNEDVLSYMSGVGQLMRRNPGVTSRLNNTIQIVVESSEPQRFIKELSRYLDPDDNSSTGSYWPLIRKINIRFPTPVLRSSGAVLVDLPGTADSNAARCKIAKDYLRIASCFFVVSPITRAVSSKVARDLCGDAFKTQLKLDGKYSAHTITFIATKCDDLSPHEIVNEPALRPVLATCEELKAINTKIQKLQAQLEVLQAATHTTDGPRQTKKRRLDVCESGLRADPTDQRLTAFIITPSELNSDVDPEGLMAYTLRASLVECKMAKKRLLAKYRSNWTKKILQKDFKDSLDRSNGDSDAEDSESDFGDEFNKDDHDHELPVFTCSARDYMRMKKKTQDSDGDPACFAYEEDTEIPALSRWISTLTIPAKEQASLNLFVEMKNVLMSVTASLEGKPHVTPQDRAILQGRWRSNEAELVILPTSKRTARELRAAHYGVRATSIVARLVKSFEEVSDAICRDLEDSVTSGLEQICRDNAARAADSVVEISDKFASRMHWRTYRATLRRHGDFTSDLNTELTMAFTQLIANCWTRKIRDPLNLSFRLKQRTMTLITDLLDEFIASVPDHLKPCAKNIQVSALNIARSLLGGARSVILQAWEEDLKRITRLLAPFVQLHLIDGYEHAAGLKIRKGVSKLQKEIFHDHLEAKKDTMFDEVGLALKKHLIAAIRTVRDTLDEHLEMVAKRVEMHMATLWDSPVVTEDDVRTRNAALATLAEHKVEVERWLGAPRHTLRNSAGNSQ